MQIWAESISQSCGPHLRNQYLCVCARMHACMCMRVYTYVWKYMCGSTCVYECAYVFMGACMCGCMLAKGSSTLNYLFIFKAEFLNGMEIAD